MAGTQRNEEWQKILIGKILIEEDKESSLLENEIFRASDLPQGNRVLPPGRPQTRDYIPDRLNVFVDKDYKINQVYYG